MKHQKAFDALKEAFNTGGSTGISQFPQGVYYGGRYFLEWFRLHPVTTGKEQKHLCRSLCKPIIMPIRKINVQLQLTKLDMLALKRAVTEFFGDYLFSSQFQVYTDNNPVTHV